MVTCNMKEEGMCSNQVNEMSNEILGKINTRSFKTLAEKFSSFFFCKESQRQGYKYIEERRAQQGLTLQAQVGHSQAVSPGYRSRSPASNLVRSCNLGCHSCRVAPTCFVV